MTRSVRLRLAEGRGPIYVALGVSLGVITAYLVGGGASYKPLAAADPCEPRPLAVLAERGVLEGIVLSGLDGAACELQVTREELAAALADEGALAEFAAARGISDAEIDAAVRAGLIRAVDDAETEGLVERPISSILRAAAENAPVPLVIDAFRAIPGDPTLPEVVEALGEAGLGISELPERGIDRLQRLLDDLLGGLGADPPLDLDRLLDPEALNEILPDQP